MCLSRTCSAPTSNACTASSTPRTSRSEHLYTHVRRANRWFTVRLLSPEFQLVQANDLAVVLGYEHHKRPRLVKYNPCNIRVHFPTVGHN